MLHVISLVFALGKLLMQLTLPPRLYTYSIHVKRGSLPEQDAVYAGHPHAQYNSVQMKRGDPVPARLAGLRRLMNGRARHLYCAAYEYETCTCDGFSHAQV